MESIPSRLASRTRRMSIPCAVLLVLAGLVALSVFGLVAWLGVSFVAEGMRNWNIELTPELVSGTYQCRKMDSNHGPCGHLVMKPDGTFAQVVRQQNTSDRRVNGQWEIERSYRGRTEIVRLDHLLRYDLGTWQESRNILLYPGWYGGRFTICIGQLRYEKVEDPP